jgi:hypothetical protein
MAACKSDPAISLRFEKARDKYVLHRLGRRKYRKSSGAMGCEYITRKMDLHEKWSGQLVD